MIKRIKQISNVGVFRNYTAKDTGLETEFGKNNFIFGLNTAGKSTLCDILKDINENKTGRISERKTIPSYSETQKIVINCSEKTISLNNDEWANNCLQRHIFVFDTEFVLKNVFDGTELAEGRTTKENFTEFILGDEGIAKIQEIEKLKIKQKEMTSKIKDATPSSHQNRTSVEISEYIKREHRSSAEIEEIKHQREGLVCEIESINKRKSNMSAIHEFAHITTFDDHTDRIIQNYKDAESILQETYELQQGTLDLYSNHLKKHFNNIGEGEAWIAKGVDLAKNITSCPFCGQDTSSSVVTSVYESIFDEKYLDFESSIRTKLSKIDLVADVGSLHEKLSGILIHMQKILSFSEGFFETEIKEIEALSESVKDSEKELHDVLSQYQNTLVSAIETKKNIPTIKVALDNKHLFELLSDYSDRIVNVNGKISHLNDKISKFKESSDLSQLDERIKTITSQIEECNNEITRFEENDQCVTYQKLVDEAESLVRNIKTSTAELSSDQKNYLDTFFESINRLFKDFGGQYYTITRVNIPDHFEPPVRRMRATIPEFQSHRSGN